MSLRLSVCVLSLSALFACAGADSDGDGLTNGEEEELGLDPESADTDGDGVDDGDELAAGTDALVADTDGDGLNDGDELAAGTDALAADTDGDGLSDGDEAAAGADPLSADSDLDGISDGDEVAAGSDPTNMFSWPGDGVWPDRSAAAEAAGVAAASTYAMGEVFPNFTAFDRNGEEVSLHDFYGSVILVDFSAGWCGPCQSVAAGAEEMWNEHRDEGFVIVHAMIDGYSGRANQRFLNSWADEYGLTFPVLGEGDIEATTDGLGDAGIYENSIPFMVIIDQDMVLDQAFTGSQAERQIATRVGQLLE